MVDIEVPVQVNPDNMHFKVQLLFYDASQVLQTTYDVFDSTTQLSAEKFKNNVVSVNAATIIGNNSARYARVRLVAAPPGGSVAGSVWFDSVEVNMVPGAWNERDNDLIVTRPHQVIRTNYQNNIEAGIDNDFTRTNALEVGSFIPGDSFRVVRDTYGAPSSDEWVIQTKVDNIGLHILEGLPNRGNFFSWNSMSTPAVGAIVNTSGSTMVVDSTSQVKLTATSDSARSGDATYVQFPSPAKYSQAADFENKNDAAIQAFWCRMQLASLLTTNPSGIWFSWGIGVPLSGSNAAWSNNSAYFYLNSTDNTLRVGVVDDNGTLTSYTSSTTISSSQSVTDTFDIIWTSITGPTFPQTETGLMTFRRNGEHIHSISLPNDNSTNPNKFITRDSAHVHLKGYNDGSGVTTNNNILWLYTVKLWSDYPLVL